MAFQPVDKSMQVNIKGVKAGQTIENVWYVTATQDFGTSEMTDVLAAVVDWAELPLTRGAFPNDITLTSVVVRDARDSDGIVMEAPITNGVGLAEGTPLPNSASLAIHKIAGIGGRHSRARVYHLGLSSLFMSAPNVVNPTVTAAICNIYRALRDTIAGAASGELALAYAIRVNEGVALALAYAVPILDFICRDSVVDSQRRRLPGRGS